MVIKGTLVYNDPQGTRIYEIIDGDLIMNVIQRKDEDYINRNDSLKSHGLYILFGNETYSTQRKIYIGQTSNIQQRINQHLKKKEFWSLVCTFQKSDESWNKAEVEYLEYLAIKGALECGCCELMENYQVPKEPYLNQEDKSMMLMFFENIKLLLLYSGFNVFQRKIYSLDNGTDNHKKLFNRLCEKRMIKNIIQDEDECSCDDEQVSITYELKDKFGDYSSTAIPLESNEEYMILPFGKISDKIDLGSQPSFVYDCLDEQKHRYIKIGFNCKDLSEAAFYRCGVKDESVWKKIVTEI